tara:strand:+ start:431 stop:1054 length:624 start_codon:yes stop_codon:yes gene_type:complete
MSTVKTNQLAHTANGASVYTLPQTDGSAGQVLTTNGSGVLSWASDKGKILQVQQTHYSALLTNSTASGGEWAPTQLNCSITPSATSSDVLITAKIAVSCEINTRRIFMRVFRDSTEIAKGDAAGNVSGSYSRAAAAVDIRASDVVEDIFFSFLDTGISTTSATTYSFRFFHSQTATMDLHINRAHTITDRFQDAFISSNVILQEVAG